MKNELTVSGNIGTWRITALRPTWWRRLLLDLTRAPPSGVPAPRAFLAFSRWRLSEDHPFYVDFNTSLAISRYRWPTEGGGSSISTYYWGWGNIRVKLEIWLKSANARDVTKWAIIDVNSIVYGRTYDTLTSIIAQFLTSLPFPDFCRKY